MSEFFPQYDFSSSMTPWQAMEQHTEISPSSSYSNFNGEVEFAGDLNVSTYMEQASFMNFYGNDSIPYPRHF